MKKNSESKVKADTVLHALKARTDAILAAVPDIIMEVDQNKKYTWANAEGYHFFGDDVIGKEAAFYFEGEQPTYEVVQPLFNGAESTFYVESWQRRKDGEKRLLAWWCRVLKDDAGKVIGALSTARDITEHKRAEMHLRNLNRIYSLISSINKTIVRVHKPEELFQAVCTIAVKQGGFLMAWIGLYDPQTKHVKPAAHAGITGDYLEKLDIFMHDRERSLGPTAAALRTASHVVVNDIAGDVRMSPWRADALRLGYRASAAFPLRVSGESRGTFNLYAAETNFFNEEELNLLDEVAADISFAMQFAEEEQQRKRAEKTLRENETRFRTLIENIPQKIFMKDLNSVYLNVNENFARDFGIRPADMVGKTDFDFFPQDLAEKYRADDQRIMESGQTDEFEEKYIQESKETWIHTVKTPVRDENGKIVAVLGVFRDITEHKRSENELVIAKEKAELSDRLKSAFLANMSHEIRTPMNAIVGFAGMLSDPDLSEDDRQRFTTIIQSRSDDLMHIISDILEISRIESGNATVVYEGIHLNQVIHEMEAVSLQKLHNAKKSRIILSTDTVLSDQHDAISTDGFILKHVFTNLLDNAVKYTESGTIRFGYLPPSGGMITLFVSDTGIGISPENQKVIFEHFRQAEVPDPHKYGGTGLGLSICKGSLSLLGGEIRVESAPGKGSTFYFTLPYDLPASIAAPPREGGRKGTVSGAYNWSDKKILLVEDESSNMEFLSILLDRTGAELVPVCSGRELRKCYEDLGDFDLVLLDVRLPDTNGWELAREIKSLRPGLPVIAQTAYALSSDRQKSQESGCDNYISKPIRKEQLLEMISGYLGDPKAT